MRTLKFRHKSARSVRRFEHERDGAETHGARPRDSELLQTQRAGSADALCSRAPLSSAARSIRTVGQRAAALTRPVHNVICDKQAVNSSQDKERMSKLICWEE